MLLIPAPSHHRKRHAIASPRSFASPCAQHACSPSYPGSPEVRSGRHHRSREPCPVHGFRSDDDDGYSYEDHGHDPLYFSPKSRGQLCSPRGGPWPTGEHKHRKGYDSHGHERKIRERWEADQGPISSPLRPQPSLSPRHPQHVGHQDAALAHPSTTHKAAVAASLPTLAAPLGYQPHASSSTRQPGVSPLVQERAALEAAAELRAVQKRRAEKQEAAQHAPEQEFRRRLRGVEDAQGRALPSAPVPVALLARGKQQKTGIQPPIETLEHKKDYNKHGKRKTTKMGKKKGKKKKKKRSKKGEIVVSTPIGPFSPGTKAVLKTQKAMKKAKEMWDVSQYVGTCCLLIEIVVTILIIIFALYLLAPPSDKAEKRGGDHTEDASDNIPPILAINILASRFTENASSTLQQHL